jgi:hypothetical protein
VIILWYVVTHLMVHGWRDIAVGTNNHYCGFEALHNSFDFYCQRGE